MKRYLSIILIATLSLCSSFFSSCSQQKSARVIENSITYNGESNGNAYAMGEMNVSSLDIAYSIPDSLVIAENVTDELYYLDDIYTGPPDSKENNTETLYSERVNLLNSFLAVLGKNNIHSEIDSLNRLVVKVDDCTISVANNSVEVYLSSGFSIDEKISDLEILNMFKSNSFLNSLLDIKSIDESNYFVYRQRDLNNDEEKTPASYLFRICKKANTISELTYNINFDSIGFSYVPDAEFPEVKRFFAYFYPEKNKKEVTADVNYVDAVSQAESEIGQPIACMLAYSVLNEGSIVPCYRFFAFKEDGVLIYKDVPCLKPY